MNVIHKHKQSRLFGRHHSHAMCCRSMEVHVIQNASDVSVAQESTGWQANVSSVLTQQSSAQRGSAGRSLPHQQHRLMGLQHAMQQICMFLVLR